MRKGGMFYDNIIKTSQKKLEKISKEISKPRKQYPVYEERYFWLSDLEDAEEIIDQSLIIKSWDKIFDLDWYSENITYKQEEKWFQAVFWELKLDQIIKIKKIISR